MLSVIYQLKAFVLVLNAQRRARLGLRSGEDVFTAFCRSLDSTGPRAEVATAIHGIVRDDRGATSIEYGLIAALIALVLIAALQALHINLFQNVADALS